MDQVFGSEAYIKLEGINHSGGVWTNYLVIGINIIGFQQSIVDKFLLF